MDYAALRQQYANIINDPDIPDAEVHSLINEAHGEAVAAELRAYANRLANQTRTTASHALRILHNKSGGSDAA